MSYLNIKLKKKLKFRLDLSQLIPGKIGKKTKTEIKTLKTSFKCLLPACIKGFWCF